jgi:hypothetical protein
MTPFQVSELLPGADRTTDDEILDWVKEAAETTYHPVGTCKMGSDPIAAILAKPCWLRSRSFPARASAPPAYDDGQSTLDGRTRRRR